MFWSGSIRTRWRPVLKPTGTSCRITGSAKGVSVANRASSAVGGPSAPTWAVPRSTSVPSRFSMRIATWTAPSTGLSMKARTSSPSNTGLR